MKTKEYEFKFDYFNLSDDHGRIKYHEVSRDSLNDQLGFDQVSELLSQETEESKVEKFLTFWGTFARVGNQIYLNEDGSVRVENRPEEVVIKSLNSFRNKPITLDHPTGLVMPSNAKQLTVGISHEDIVYDRGLGRIRITLLDQEAIKAIQKSHRQLSAGYLAEVQQMKGDWHGDPYTHQQTSIYGNHISLVSQGRAGELVASHFKGNKITADSIDAVDLSEVEDKTLPWSVQIYHNNLGQDSVNIPDENLEGRGNLKASDLTEKDTAKNEGKKKMPVQILIDSVPIEVSETAAIAVNNKIKNDERDLNSVKEDLKKVNAQLQEANSQLESNNLTKKTELDSANGTIAIQKAEIEKLKTEKAELEATVKDSLSVDNMRSIINNRIVLEQQASSVLKNEKFDSLSDRQIKTKVLQKLYGDSFSVNDSDSEDYVNGCYKAAIALKQNANKTSTQSRIATQTSHHSPTTDSVDEYNFDEDEIINAQREALQKNAQMPLSGNIKNF